MPGNDERDPLDSWLSQQVRPMPPPPGTFELITRRARRRKLRKLAVTVVSAAAVAAGVAVAVPNVLALRVTPAPLAGSQGGRQSSATNIAGGTPSTNGSASHVPSPTHSPSPASVPTEPVGPVPANFQPSSVTFVDTQHAWVIGQAGTPGKCANKKNPYICTSIAHTDDAGSTWHGGPAPTTGAPSGPTGVSGIRFLDGVNGWAFGPELWVTHNEGDTWYQINTGGQRVTDLETVNHRAYALFASQCSGASGANFAADCTSYTLMTTTADSDTWVNVGGPTNELTAGGAPTSAVLALWGTTGYLVAPDGTLFEGPVTGGAAWTRQGSVQCQPGPAQANGLPSRVLLAVQDSTQLAVACVGPSFGGVTIFTSGNSGAGWTAQPATAWTGVTQPATATSLTAAPDGTLVLATTGGIYVLPARGSHWQQAVGGSSGPSGGFGYVGMTTSTQGVALPANTGLNEIWMTFNAGQAWEARPIPAG
jgi:hypothetical protein